MPSTYDVAIIGGGMAGLIAGLYLQNAGKRTIILEHGQNVGGNMSGIRRNGFYFDCGDQSMESFGILFPILEELGLYHPEDWMPIKWRFLTPDCDVPLHSYDQVRADFQRYFPQSACELDAWFDYLLPICQWYPEFIARHAQTITSRGLTRAHAHVRLLASALRKASTLKEFMQRSASDLAEKVFTRDPRLRFLFGDYGYPNLPLMVASTFWYTFIYDYHYPKAGIQGLMNMLADAYRQRGGEIRLRSTVDALKTSGNIVTGLLTSKDEYVEAAQFINTGNLKRLVSEMLDNPTVWGYRDRQEILKSEVTLGNTAAYLGVDISSAELMPRLKEHHTVYWRSYETALDVYDQGLHRKGWSMISATSLFLPELAPPGQNSIVVQIYTPYCWMNDWGTNAHDPFTRTADYTALKHKVLDDIIADTEYVIPGLAGRIVYKELATPRSLARWTLNADGNPMGWGLDVYSSKMAKRRMRIKTPLKNLRNAGHYAMCPGGVITAAMTGRMVARQLARTAR